MVNTDGLRVFDDGGKALDRYTVCYEPLSEYEKASLLQLKHHSHKTVDNLWHAFALSAKPDWPLGVSLYTHADPSYCGEEIEFEELPERVQKHVLERLAD